MSAPDGPPIIDQVRRLYVGGDIAFEAVLRAHPCRDDEALADLIDADGRVRLGKRLETPLERYLKAVGEGRQNPVSLDAAIDFALRSAVKLGMSEAEAAARLKQKFPKLSGAIDAASEFSRALTSTDGVGAPSSGLGTFSLPCDVGPLSLTGRPRYKLIRHLGSGSQGAAYLAEDRQLSAGAQAALVCVKVLALDLSHASDQLRVVGEAMKARRINHPSVVRVLDRGIFQGHEYIVYEYIEARSLDQWVAARARRLRPREAVELMIRVAEGVQAAHSAGLVHRDLKPDNILMTGEGDPKITDFGAAAIVNVDDSLEGGAGGPVGNLAFMAPEQFWMSRGAIAPTADLYALGGILWHLLTGELPNGETADEVRRKHAGMADGTGAGSTLLKHPSLDPDLVAICRRALAPSVDLRYSSADALVADLKAWLDRRPIAWNQPTLWRRASLGVRRQPMLVLLLAAMTTLGGMTAWVLHLTTRVALESAKISTQAPRRAGVLRPEAGVRPIGLAAIHLHARTDEGGSLLHALAAIDSAMARHFKGEPGQEAADQASAIRVALAQAEADSSASPVEAPIWRALLGMRLLRDRDPAEARPVLARASERLAQLRGRDGPTLACLDGLLVLAEPRAASGETRQVARQLRERLKRSVEILAGVGEFDDLRKSMLETMGRLPSEDGADAMWPTTGAGGAGGIQTEGR